MKRPATKSIVIALLTLVGGAALFAANFFSPNVQPYGYIAPPATSSANFQSGTETLYAPWFENGTFTGDLLAIPVAADGSPDALNPNWRGQITVASQDADSGRFIVTTTRDGSNVLSVVPFRWPSLSDDQRSLVDALSAGDATSPVLDYVRGDRSQEQQNGGAYRNRSSVFGAIIHSPPRYVGAPSSGFTFSGYPAFAVANANRSPRVYVGANDGMLHAFDAVTGDEVFAFVPGEVVENLPLLKRTPYLNQYYVDGYLTNGDAMFADSSWHSVLLGGLGAGGQGYFALDVTSAADITAEDNSAAGAGSRVLWEFNDASDDGENMGYSYGRPSVVRLENGTWVAILANGYVNNANDGAQGDRKARLYALNIETGAIVGQMAVSDDTDSALSPNGLSSPTVIDADSNFKADAVYAGDIKGNVWRFDISGDPADWNGDTDATRLFTATDANDVPQAITTPPDVTFHPSGGFLIFVGTGRLFDGDDLLGGDDIQLNTIYALRDKVPGTTADIDTDTLLAQTVTEKAHANGTRVRVVTDNPLESGVPIEVDWTSYNGWKVNLPDGERLLTEGRLRDGRFQFLSVNPLVATGENWFMQLDYLTGRAPDEVVVDIDGDNALTAADNVDGNDDGDTGDAVDRVIAQYQSFGLASQPLFASISSTKDSALINHLNAIDPTEADELEIFDDYAGDPGLAGGHFDLDTSTQIYDLSDGSTNNHTHEWDDKTGLTGVDYFNIAECTVKGDKDAPSPCVEDPSLLSADPDYDHIDSTISDDTQQFIVIVANDRLSTGGVMEINSTSVSVVTYGNLVSEAVAGTKTMPVYQMGASPPAGVQQLTSLKMNFHKLAILQGGLLGTNTGCVKANDPGPNGEYRNGALTVQAIAWDGTKTAAQLIDDDNHYAESDLLWEATIFWHWDGDCYHESAWQSQWDSCIVDGNIWECADVPVPDDLPDPPPDPDPVPACYLGEPNTLTKANGCTADTFFPTTLEWFTAFDKELCPTPTVPVDHEFEFEFKEEMTDEEFTLTFNYDSGSSESVTFGPNDIFATPQGAPLEVDLTELSYADGKNDDKLKGIALRNRSGSAISLDSIDISWTGGVSSQHLEKSKAKKNAEYGDDLKDEDQHTSPWNWAINRTLGATSGGGNCEYTLELEYYTVDHDTTIPTFDLTVSHDFDDRLTGIGGDDLEIDMDEAVLENGNRDISCIRLRSRLEDLVVITGATITSVDGTSSQWLQAVDDVTVPAPAAPLDVFTGVSIMDAETDVAAGGVSFSVLSGLGGISVGGAVAGTENCPDGVNWDDPPGTGGGWVTDPPVIDPPIDPPPDDEPTGPPETLTPEQTGFNITNTTGSGNNQRGRLMWREIVR